MTTFHALQIIATALISAILSAVLATAAVSPTPLEDGPQVLLAAVTPPWLTLTAPGGNSGS